MKSPSAASSGVGGETPWASSPRGTASSPGVSVGPPATPEPVGAPDTATGAADLQRTDSGQQQQLQHQQQGRAGRPLIGGVRREGNGRRIAFRGGGPLGVTFASQIGEGGGPRGTSPLGASSSLYLSNQTPSTPSLALASAAAAAQIAAGEETNGLTPSGIPPTALETDGHTGPSPPGGGGDGGGPSGAPASDFRGVYRSSGGRGAFWLRRRLRLLMKWIERVFCGGVVVLLVATTAVDLHHNTGAIFLLPALGVQAVMLFLAHLSLQVPKWRRQLKGYFHGKPFTLNPKNTTTPPIDPGSICAYLAMLIHIYLRLYARGWLSYSLPPPPLSLCVSLYPYRIVCPPASICLCASLCLPLSLCLSLSPCLSLSLCVSICLRMSPCVSMRLHMPPCVSTCSTCMSLCVHLSPCVSVCLYVSPYASLCLHMSPCVSWCLHMSPCVSVCLPVSPSVSIYLHMSLYASPCLRVSRCVSILSLHVTRFLDVSRYVSLYLCVCLRVCVHVSPYLSTCLCMRLLFQVV